MDTNGMANALLMVIALVAAGLGIYGLTESYLAGIFIPISWMAHQIWKANP